jgi:ribosome-binding factor A
VPTSRRIARLERVILETVALTIQREIHDPRVGMVTVTRVKLAPDLSGATVWWSCLGDEAQKRTTTRGLAAVKHILQRHVAQAMGTRVTPGLNLRFDAGLEKAQHLETIFDKLRAERGDPPPSPDDPLPEVDEDDDSDDAGVEGEPDGEAPPPDGEEEPKA